MNYDIRFRFEFGTSIKRNLPDKEMSFVKSARQIKMHSSSLYFLIVLAVASGLPQFKNYPSFPNFKPFTPTTKRYDYNRYDNTNSVINQGSSDDGQYHPDNSGAYFPDNSGAYVHDDSPYQHQTGPDGDDGSYKGDNNPYVHQTGPDGGYGPDSGKYIDNSDSGAYKPDIYSGDNSGDYKGDNSGSYNENDGDQGTGNKFPFPGTGNKFPAPSTGNKYPFPGNGQGQKQPGKYGGVQLCHDPLCRVLRLDETVEQDGYHYAYETENKIFGEEQGRLKNKGTDQEAMNAKGYYEYTGPDGSVYRVDYTADENGFHPVGNHIPTVPPAIQRSLEYLRSIGQL